MAKERVFRIGIMPQHEVRARALAIARGEYKPKAGDPKVWFPSMRSLAEVLSDKNRDLLRAIAEQQPRSVNELARITKRAPGNLSRTLHTLEGYGLVELKKTDGTVRPVAKATHRKAYVCDRRAPQGEGKVAPCRTPRTWDILPATVRPLRKECAGALYPAA